jgi:N-formylglutamate deformylase
MPAVAASHATLHPGLHHADFVIGDRDGTTAVPALSRKVCDFLRGQGYSVDYNHPYKGVELVRRYGDPARQRHGIQIEVNRKIYMDEQTLEIKAEGFARLQRDLRMLTELLLATDPRRLDG